MIETKSAVSVDCQLTFANRWDHLLARWGWRRGDHRVVPGLYALGSPTQAAPVFVTANYTLSFDALRTSLKGLDAYVLVLDTQGVNVWCAAGKGTFSTAELVKRVEMAGLKEVVTHRTLILPQLGATGVAAHEVKKQTSFRVEYGPILAEDLPDYLKTHQAAPAMRQVRFNLWDRMVLIPVELVAAFIPTLLAALALTFLDGPLTAAWLVAAVLAGAGLFPILLPWLPTPEFSTRGLLLGGLVSLVFAGVMAAGMDIAWGWRLLRVAALGLVMTPITAYLALNFTGCTPWTSWSGVKREISSYIPLMAWMFGAGIVLWIGFVVLRVYGGVR